MTRTIATALAALALAACSNPTYIACRDIPAGGCPGVANTVNCSDPTCDEIYNCNPTTGTWSHVATCPAHDAGVDAGSPVDAKLDVSPGLDATSARDVAFDVPEGASGGPGCMPPTGVDLEMPDCPLEQAILCAPSSCCGCEDLYVCASGGWNLWGECVDGGAIVPMPP